MELFSIKIRCTFQLVSTHQSNSPLTKLTASSFFLVDDFGVHLCHSHGGMTKQLRYGIEIRTKRQHHGRECVPGRVKSKTFGDSGRFGPRLEILVDV